LMLVGCGPPSACKANDESTLPIPAAITVANAKAAG
jgi:hypothetical protein